jgi:hypothetical protein
MHVVLIDGIQGDFSAKGQVCQTLEQAFAQIVCHAGLSYAFEPQEHGWELVLTDVERPDRSPDPVYTTCIKPRDAQHDLMAQAVDGRVRGYVAIYERDFETARIMRSAQANLAVGRRMRPNCFNGLDFW